MSYHVDASRSTTETRNAAAGRAAAIAALAAIIMTAAPRPSSAQAPADAGWVGKRVVQKHANFRLRVENQEIDPKLLATYRVEQVNGPWLWLYAPGRSGWAPADEVVPVEDAINYFTDVIRANPRDAHGYTMRGKIWAEERKEKDIAMADYNDALRLDPATAYVYNNRGTIYAAKREYDKAIADYNEAIRIDPAEAIYFTNRGSAWLAKKEYDKAIADLNEALRLEPNVPMIYRSRGHTHRAKLDYARALADYDQAIRLDPKDFWAYNSRAWLLATCVDPKFRDGKKAIESATRACELCQDREAYCVGTRAAAFAEAGDFDQAIKLQIQANAMYDDAEDKRLGDERIKLYRDKKPYHELRPYREDG